MGRLTQRAIIPRYFASRTTSFEGYAAYSTHIFFSIAIIVRLACVPLPLSNGVPPFNGYLHGSSATGPSFLRPMQGQMPFGFKDSMGRSLTTRLIYFRFSRTENTVLKVCSGTMIIVMKYMDTWPALKSEGLN